MEPVISIIDDDKAVRDALQRLLTAYGFTAIVFESAEHFLATDARYRAACLILDVRMSGMSGIALHEYLISEGRTVPTILITARPSGGERDRAIAGGVFSYLAKPLGERLLLDTVQNALQQGVPAIN